jgi:hypothetical protein
MPSSSRKVYIGGRLYALPNKSAGPVLTPPSVSFSVDPSTMNFPMSFGANGSQRSDNAKSTNTVPKFISDNINAQTQEQSVKPRFTQQTTRNNNNNNGNGNNNGNKRVSVTPAKMPGLVMKHLQDQAKQNALTNARSLRDLQKIKMAQELDIDMTTDPRKLMMNEMRKMRAMQRRDMSKASKPVPRKETPIDRIRNDPNMSALAKEMAIADLSRNRKTMKMASRD